MQTKTATRNATRSSFASAAGGFVTTSVRTVPTVQPAQAGKATTRR